MKIKTMILAALSTAVLPVAVPLPAYTASASANSCLDQNTALLAISERRPPQSAGTVVLIQHLLYVLDAAIAYLDRNCSGEPDYAQVRAEYKNTRDQAYTTCTQVASSASYCQPKAYGQ